MKPIGTHNYFIYITTNKNKAVLYTRVTNDLLRRLFEHKQDAETIKQHFTGKYNAYFLIYWERFQDIKQAIAREKEIKGWLRKKKHDLITAFNPDWGFLNEDVSNV